MASPFNIKKTTQVGRNGFDLSQRHLFGACAGMLLPIMHEETLPGDTFKIGLDSFTRMRRLKTAAFARFKEYFDFYFISKDTLWPYYNQMVVNNNEPTRTPVVATTTTPAQVPNIRQSDLCTLIKNSLGDFSDMGLSFGHETEILYDLLGFGSYKDQYADQQHSNDTWVSLLPWCAYQKIYADYYRNPQWERRDVVSYNLNNFYASTNHLSGSSIAERKNMFKMRYANWNKDYFMGLYPSQQFGDVSVVSASVTAVPGMTNVAATNGYPLYAGVDGSILNGGNVASLVRRSTLTSDVSIVDLRRAQALQRLKEVTMTNGSSMYQQVKAHYGFELPEGRKDAAEYIGGFDNDVTISDVDATAAGEANGETSNVGEIFGKATAASDIRKTLEYTAKDFGYIMCIYHVKPLLEYDACGIKRSNLKLTAADEFIPEFDKIGFGDVTFQELFRSYTLQLDDQYNIYSKVMGYSSRYLDLKTSYDRVHGSFMHGASPSTDSAWTIALTWNYILDTLKRAETAGSLDWRWFKINPLITNNVSAVTISVDPEDPTTDEIIGVEPFMVSAKFNLYKTSNMSVDSLPY